MTRLGAAAFRVLMRLPATLEQERLAMALGAPVVEEWAGPLWRNALLVTFGVVVAPLWIATFLFPLDGALKRISATVERINAL